MVIACNSKSVSKEIFKPPATSNNSLDLTINYTDNPEIKVQFGRSYLKQDYLILLIFFMKQN